MTEKTLLGLTTIFATSLIACQILGAWTSEVVELVINPSVQYDIYEPAGKPFNISCQGVGGDESKFAFMKWINPKGNVVPEGIPGVVKGEKNLLLLTFSSPRIKDSGTYKCIAVYNNKHTLERKVDIEFYGLKPQFERSFENVTVAEREKVNLICIAKGEVPIIYEWYNKNGDKISNDASLPIYVSNSGNWSTLTIETLKPQDRGSYTCTASNTHGLVSKVYLLHVLPSSGPRPEFELTFENFTATEGKRVELHCTAQGEKPITYEWFNKKEDKISDDGSMPIFFTNETNRSTLIIRNVMLEDEGIYTCTASNTHGLVSKLFLLRVLPSTGNDTDDNSTPRVLDARAVNISASSVVFEISTSEPFEYLQVKYKDKRDKYETQTRFTRASKGVYSFEKLIPGGLYSFYFRIVPSENGNWSDAYNVTLLPAAPEIIFRSLGDNGFQVQWFRQFEDIMRGTIDFHEIKYFTLQLDGGKTWIPNKCTVKIQVSSCAGSYYSVTGISSNVYYQIEVRAHTVSGYGAPFHQIIFMQR